MEIRFGARGGGGLGYSIQSDGQLDRHNEVNGTLFFSNFVDVPKMIGNYVEGKCRLLTSGVII